LILIDSLTSDYTNISSLTPTFSVLSTPDQESVSVNRHVVFLLAFLARQLMIMTRKQFAYHEATFYLVRLLQQFTEFTLDDANNVKPPADWAGCDGLKGKDKIVPGAHLTLYVKGGLWVKMKEVKSADV